MTLHITWPCIHNFVTITFHVNTWQVSPVLSLSSSFYMQVAVLTWKLCVCVCVCVLLGIEDRLCLCQICSSGTPQVFTPCVFSMWSRALWYCVVLLAYTIISEERALSVCTAWRMTAVEHWRRRPPPPKHLYSSRVFVSTTHKIAVVAAVIFIFQHKGS